MRRKQRRLLRKLLGWTVVFVLVFCIGLALFFSVKGILKLFQSAPILKEEENLHLSPPSNEDILYIGLDSKIHLYQTGMKQDHVLTKGDDFAPSWDKDGSGFYFLRKLESDTFAVYYYSLADQMEKILSVQEIYTAYDLPDPDHTWIRFSPDGLRIIQSSMEFGIQVIDREKTAPETFFKRKTVSLRTIWSDLSLNSRNDRFCLLSSHRKKTASYVQGITSSLPVVNQLFLAQTDLADIRLVDQSETPFQGYSFSQNGYTFVYSKNNQIYYVDSIQKIQPMLLIEGTFPSIKPETRYGTLPPKWTDFNLINAVLIQPLPSPYHQSYLLANDHSLAIYQIDKQRLYPYHDRGKLKSSLLGYQLTDILITEVTGDENPDILCSWQSHEKALGAERLSHFTLTQEGRLKEVFRSSGQMRNSWKWVDLNQDGVLEVLDLSIDREGEDASMLENLAWADVYQVSSSGWKRCNDLFPSYYQGWVDKYKDFLSNAIKNPSQYGKWISVLENWIHQAEILSQSSR